MITSRCARFLCLFHLIQFWYLDELYLIISLFGAPLRHWNFLSMGYDFLYNSKYQGLIYLPHRQHIVLNIKHIFQTSSFYPMSGIFQLKITPLLVTNYCNIISVANILNQMQNVNHVRGVAGVLSFWDCRKIYLFYLNMPFPRQIY